MAEIKIDTEKYKLSDRNYYSQKNDKSQIVIGHSSTNGMRHFIGWENRRNGNYKHTANFTIDMVGNIYQHFDPNYYSDFIGIKEVDEYVISIVLENEGWLLKDIVNDRYINWLGDTYSRRGSVIDVRWRGKQYWAPYTPKQISSVTKLVKYLCDEYKIDCKCIGHNTYDDEVFDYEGVVFKSNYVKELTEISPAFNCNLLKNKIEIN